MEKRLKPLVLVLLLILTTLSLSAQVFVTLEPTFLRPGLLYNKQLTNHPNSIGIYSHIWYGNIKGTHPDGGKFYTDNFKLGIGVSLRTRGIYPMLGVNRNWFFNTVTDDRIIQLTKIKRYSFEVGARLKINNRLTALMMTDFINWESIVGISYNFSDKLCSTYHKHSKRIKR